MPSPFILFMTLAQTALSLAVLALDRAAFSYVLFAGLLSVGRYAAMEAACSRIGSSPRRATLPILAWMGLLGCLLAFMAIVFRSAFLGALPASVPVWIIGAASAAPFANTARALFQGIALMKRKAGES